MNLQFSQLIEKALSQPETHGKTLGKATLESPGETVPLLTLVFEDNNLVFKQRLLQILIETASDNVSAELLKFLDRKKPELFSWVASFMGTKNYPPAISRLVESISDDEPKIALAAIKALSQIGDKSTIQALAQLFTTSSNEVILGEALKSLADLSGLLCPIFLDAFNSLTHQKKPWILKFLAQAGYQPALPLFEECLTRSPLEFGLFAISGLGNIRSPKAVEILGKFVKHPEWFIRKKVVEALGNCPCSESVSYVIAALSDTFVLVRAAAIESLSKVGHVLPDKIVETLNKSSGELRISLIRAMSQIKHPDFVKPIIAILKDRSTLFFSIDALGEFGEKNAAIPLETFLRDEEWFNRLNALEALAKLPLDDVQKYARQCLKDENDMVRNAATRILRAA